MLYNLFENRDFVSVFAVALLAEGVDRNMYFNVCCLLFYVALLAEGVDRNLALLASFLGLIVALLAEGVDRNDSRGGGVTGIVGSPSSRRAWIEIRLLLPLCAGAFVALLAEGVDRNHTKVFHDRRCQSRPPRGGRG